ncbi:O-glucosyltransferase rumi [Portunus trituberculatus]|uniref:O-glucosyltransferase rumi n=1 Tax=Portunus trituberculatus TaxID=210409 RepID=A0A5B7ED94_PORTR|nr:O-glucosyltransferase rumi [Portunus trituberculatus]
MLRKIVTVMLLIGVGGHGDLKETCDVSQREKCSEETDERITRYSRDTNEKWAHFIAKIDEAVSAYKPCAADKCSCHYHLIKDDLFVFKDGISKETLQSARESTFHTSLNDLQVIDKLPDMEMVINTRDWPQVPQSYGMKMPVFSFSKTEEYIDITYPAWTFWEGGPAISLYPTGLGRWDLHRASLAAASKKWQWQIKKTQAFFRGSRTSSERDPLIYLSRDSPHLVNAQYTKNQAWKSDADTLFAPPASEVSLEDHCQYKYLFNYRGVAASFRFKHLFLCGSLVFHSEDRWIEFFYPRMKPWVHYIPVRTGASKNEIRELLQFAQENDPVVSQIAERGQNFIKNHLRMKDVLCYWKKLLVSYASLLNYQPLHEDKLVEITKKS